MGIFAFITGAIILGGVFYFSSKIENTSKFTFENNTLPAAAIIGLDQNAVDLPPNEPDNVVPKTNDGLALADKSKITKDIVKSQIKNKYTVATAQNETMPEKTITKEVPTVTSTQTFSEPTLVVEKGEQPKGSLLVADARRVPFTTIELTAKGGDITINSLLLERGGMASDRIFTEVGVLDMGIERALNAKHQYTMKDSFTIKDGETQEIVLYGNVTDIDTLVAYEGQVASISLVGIDTDAKISGLLPLTGSMHTVNSTLVIGSIEAGTSGIDPGVNRNIDVNTNSTIFSAIKLSASSVEPLQLKYFAWTQNGSVSSNDIANIQTCVVYKSNTNCFDATDDDGKYYFSEFDDVRIEKGESVEVYVRGDTLPSASNRTVNFDVDSSYDIAAFGLTYQNYIYSYGGDSEGAQPEGSYSITEYPFYNGYSHSIVTGSISGIR